MAILNKRRGGKQQIDISGPAGNAFALIGNAQSIAKSFAMPKEDIQKITEEMMSGDYENLLEVFDREFGEVVDLVR